MRTDPDTGRTSAELLPRFDTISYAELSERVQAIINALASDPVRPGDRVALLGFTSVDYTCVDIALIGLGAVSVPLQTSAPVGQLRPIISETEPTVIASSVDYLERRSGTGPHRLRAGSADRVRLPAAGRRPP